MKYFMFLFAVLPACMNYSDLKYLDYDLLNNEPKIFISGYLNNDSLGAFCSVFSPDMKEFYFVKLMNDGSKPGVLAYIQKEYKTWSEVKLFPFTTGIDHDNDMCISYDNKKMFFRSFRALPDGTKPLKYSYLWYAERTEKGWSDAEPLYCGGELVVSGYPSISKQGTLFFSSQKDGVAGIYKSEFINGEYTRIELEYIVNDSIVTEGDLFIAPDESYMIISCFNHPENLYNSEGDLYVVFKKDDNTWTKAINMGPEINTECGENCPAVTPDGKYLFFNRYCEKMNAGNIYWTDISIIEKL